MIGDIRVRRRLCSTEPPPIQLCSEAVRARALNMDRIKLKSRLFLKEPTDEETN